jgi:uncharacterized protein YjbI with pentapeptide repeats
VRTQEALRQLDPEHKAALLSYLYNSHLIDDELHVISLKGDDLRNGQFANLNLSDSDMTGADFSDADLHGVNLRFSTLPDINFSGADLSGANLSGADLRNVDISNANLAGANLAGVTGISIDQLGKASSLAGATLPDGSVQPGNENEEENENE